MSFQINTSHDLNRSIDYFVEDEKLGEITWQELDGVMHMNHTYVSDRLRGQGIAKKLLDEAAVYARKNHLKMNAICSYVMAAFQKSNEYDDIRA